MKCKNLEIQKKGRKKMNQNIENAAKTTKKMSSRTIKLIIIAILIAILAILVPVGYSLFSDTDTKNTETRLGEIEVELVEDWPDPGDEYTPPGDPTPDTETYNEYGISKQSKKVHGHSNAEVDAYVRIRCIPIIEYKNPSTEEWITLPVTQDNIIVNVTGDTWVSQGNYWYYTKVLKQNENTDDMNINWEIAEIPSEVAEYPIRTNVKVLLEYSQASNDAWKNNFQIEALPEGVQAYQE